MAVPDQDPINSHIASGASGVFAYSFQIAAATDLAVTKDGAILTLNVDYTVTGAGVETGGTITVTPTPAAGVVITIYRDTQLKRDDDFQTGGDLPAPQLNRELDRLWQALQEIFSGGKGAPTAVRVPQGETIDALPAAALRADRLLGFDSLGRAVALLPSAGDATSLALDIANTASASKGAGQEGYNPNLAYQAWRTGAALNDMQLQMIWFISSEAERAAIKAGTSTTDHTATIAAAIALVGARGLNFGAAGWRWNISASLTPVSGATYSGKAKLRAINAAAITGALFRAAAAVSRVTIADLELDCNGDNNGANYGIWLTGGTDNRVERVYVHDSRQAGIAMEAEQRFDVLDCRVANCGRATSVTGGASTDNHGIMIFSASVTAMRDFEVSGNVVTSAYRKGITTYSAAPGTVLSGVIANNNVQGCGVTPMSGGGIYLANAAATTDQDGITLTGNNCSGNYVDYEIANCKRIAGAANLSRNSAAQGVAIETCQDASLPGFAVSDAGTDGILVANCSQIALGTIEIRRANRTSAANGAGLHLNNSTFCSVSPGSLIYDETPLQQFGILEDGTSDNNDLVGITVVGAVTSLYSTGANTRFGGRSGRNTGFGVATPRNTVDIDGGLSFSEQAITLANGANQNVAMPSKAGVLISNAPTGAYSIGGLQGGHAGRRITLVNYTGFAMTLNHQDAGSSAANRFALPGSANKVVPVQGAVELVYSTIGGGAWFVIG